MASTSETSDDDGSNGSDPNKKPEELLKNQNEKPKEEDHKEEVDQNFAPIPRHIPEELIECTVALVRRCHYPRISPLSRTFRHVISSEELLVTRSLLGLTEPILYALITFKPFAYPSWYVLHRSNISLRLSRITSLPPMFRGSTTVTIGHKMYVMGGRIGLNQPVKTVIVIDCRSYRWEYLQSMKRDRCYAASGVIDGKIYVVGGRKKRYDDWVEVFDVQNGIWETVPGLCCFLASSSGEFLIHVVLDNKIYILDGDHCLAYNPRQRGWENWGPGSPERLFWHASSCVVDDLLYAIVPQSSLGSPIVVYDPRDRVWRPVKGVDKLPSLVYIKSRMASFGGKLVILGWYDESQNSCDNDSEKYVFCVEVALWKREDGDIWGKFESISLLDTIKSPFIEISRTVTV